MSETPIAVSPAQHYRTLKKDQMETAGANIFPTIQGPTMADNSVMVLEGANSAIACKMHKIPADFPPVTMDSGVTFSRLVQNRTEPMAVRPTVIEAEADATQGKTETLLSEGFNLVEKILFGLFFVCHLAMSLSRLLLDDFNTFGRKKSRARPGCNRSGLAG